MSGYNSLSCVVYVLQWGRSKDEDILCFNTMLLCIWGSCIRRTFVQDQRLIIFKIAQLLLLLKNFQCSWLCLVAGYSHVFSFWMFQNCQESDGFFLIHIWMLRTKITEVRECIFYHLALSKFRKELILLSVVKYLNDYFLAHWIWLNQLAVIASFFFFFFLILRSKLTSLAQFSWF